MCNSKRKVAHNFLNMLSGYRRIRLAHIIFTIKLQCNHGRSSLFDQFTPEIREKLPTVAIHKWIIFRRLIRSVRFVRLGFLPFGLTCPGLFASWSLYRQGLCVWRETETHTRSQTHQKINLAAGYNSRPYFNSTRTRSGKLDYKYTSKEQSWLVSYALSP
jgi:hypothetical protein